MVRKLILSLAILSLLVGSAVGQKKFDTRIGSGMGRNDYPGWYLTSENSPSDTTWLIRDSASVDTSATFWSKPGWNIFTAVYADLSEDSADFYLVLETSPFSREGFAAFDSVAVTNVTTWNYKNWKTDTIPTAIPRYFRFVVRPTAAGFYDRLVDTSVNTSVEIDDEDSTTWIITAAGLTQATDTWNGAKITAQSGDCDGQTSVVTDFNATGDTVHFDAFSSCTLSTNDSVIVDTPHPDSSLNVTGKVFTREK